MVNFKIKDADPEPSMEFLPGTGAMHSDENTEYAVLIDHITVGVMKKDPGTDETIFEPRTLTDLECSALELVGVELLNNQVIVEDA